VSDSRQQIPRFPAAAAAALRVLPLAPLSASLTAVSRSIARRHPGLFRRLGEHGHSRFVLDPTDLPLVILLEPAGGRPRVTVTRGPATGEARIAGPLAALLGLVHGAYDGDALFFSRDLVIEGDTGAALALRNAIDDAELDLSQEVLRLSGPLRAPLARVVARAERLTGVSLTRAAEGAAW
jgi:predicted lipid carrier protein YhbT